MEAIASGGEQGRGYLFDDFPLARPIAESGATACSAITRSSSLDLIGPCQQAYSVAWPLATDSCLSDRSPPSAGASWFPSSALHRSGALLALASRWCREMKLNNPVSAISAATSAASCFRPGRVGAAAACDRRCGPASLASARRAAAKPSGTQSGPSASAAPRNISCLALAATTMESSASTCDCKAGSSRALSAHHHVDSPARSSGVRVSIRPTTVRSVTRALPQQLPSHRRQQELRRRGHDADADWPDKPARCRRPRVCVLDLKRMR